MCQAMRKRVAPFGFALKRGHNTCNVNCLVKWFLLLNFISLLLALSCWPSVNCQATADSTAVNAPSTTQPQQSSHLASPSTLFTLPNITSAVPSFSFASSHAPSSPHRIHRRNSLFELQSSSSSSSSQPASSSASLISSIGGATSLYHLVPHFTAEPYGSVRLSNLYGGIIPCGVQLVHSVSGQSPASITSTAADRLVERIYWEVRDVRTLDDSHFSPAIDIPGLREHRTDGSLAFLPFTQETSLVSNELHNALYRCVAVTSVGTIASRSILVTLVFEKPSIVVRSYDATVTEGNDALLKCTANSELYRVVAWHTDDGDIFLPFDQHTNYIPLDIRHYVLPSGELLVASVRPTDARRQFRCRVAHMLTGERVDSNNWARIKLSDKSSHISYRPRFNLNASLRQTLAIDDSTHHNAPVDLYCSFDGQPPPNISWYFIAYQADPNTRPAAQPIAPPDSAPSSATSLTPTPRPMQLSTSRRIASLRHLRINQPSVADMGTYVCIANNSHFEVRHETDLLLRSMLQVNLTTDQPSMPLLPGDSLTLWCNVTASHPFDGLDQVLNSRFIITYHWYHNLAPIFDDIYDKSGGGASKGGSASRHSYYANSHYSNGGAGTVGKAHMEKVEKNVLRIRDLRYSDTGVYQCFVRLTGPDYVEWLQAATAVTLKQSPPALVATFAEQILIADNELALKCTATGIPAPLIIWQRNGFNLTDHTANLIAASHAHHQSSALANSLYRYKTGASSTKHIASGASGGGSTSDNYPKLLGEEEQFGTVSYFNISSIRPQDVGLFRCLAINSAGVASHQARISVIGPPYVQQIPDVTAVQGQSVTVNCAYSGYPIEEVFFIKAKRRLPYDERHVITSLGSLTITQVDKADEDEYTCVVVGENGQRSEQTFRFVVVSPPVLGPIMFSDALEEGMRATAVCSVVSGDAPIQLQWLKDGQPLLAHARADQHVQVLNIKEFISSLIISNITRRHQGVYTCLATTPYTNSNRTAMMRVKAPPKWLIKPSNQFAITASPGSPVHSSTNRVLEQTNSGHYSHYVRFDCLATGNPTPVIRWKFLRPKFHKAPIEVPKGAVDSSQYDSVPILSSPQIHVLENGSLLIRSLDKSKYEGVYLCEVTNGVGKSLEARASLVIHNTPQISLKILPHNSNGGDVAQHVSQSSIDENVVQLALRRDSQVSLSCTGGGVLPLSINWFKNGHEISVFDTASITATGSFRVFESSKQSATDRQFGERTSNLILKHLSRSDNAAYVCMARNVYGVSTKSVILQVLEPPDAPEALKAIEVGSRTVTLSWAVVYTGNLPLLSQNIEYKKESDKTWHNALMIKSNTNTVTVHGLAPLTPYEFRVSFVNELGTSEHSRSITLTTQMEAPTVMPDNLRATPLSTHAIRLTWSIRLPSPDSAEIEVIDGFYIGYRAVAGNGLTQSDQPSSYTYKTITNTPIQQMYSKMLPSADSGPGSWPSKYYRSPSSGSSPSSAFLIKLHNQSSGDKQGDGPSVEYLKMSRTEMENGAASSMQHQHYEHLVETLTRQTQYQFVVQAFNEKGAGPTSVEVTARTFTHDPPKAPNFRIDNVSTHEALLSWDYGTQIQSSSSSLAPSNADTGPLLVDGYVISYHVATVKQHDNFYGSEKLLDPEMVSSSSSTGDSSKDDWQSVTISSPSTASFTIRNLRCGTEYIARIEAFNEMGSGKPSELLRFSTLGSVPIPPEKYSREFIQSNITYITVNLAQWSDGGCPISGYSIKYRSRRMHYHQSVIAPAGTNQALGSGWITLSTHLMPEKDTLIIRDLQPGTWHDLIISAQNDAGKREAEFSFATLTETGATVEPLHAFESRMGGAFGSSSYGSASLFGALFEDPMIFIPALCTVIVLLVVTSTSAFLYVMRIRHETLQMTNGEETYCSHRTNSRSDDLSLNSYPTNNSNCHNGQAGKLAQKNGGNVMYDKGISMAESEPLYEQTTNFGHQKLSYAAQQVNKSPLHQAAARVNLLKQMSNENLLDSMPPQQTPLMASTGCDPNSVYGFVKGSAMFDSNKQQFIKTLGRQANSNQLSSSSTSSSSTKHLYQMPEQVKQEANAMMTLKRGPQQQMQQQQSQAELIEINGPLGPMQMGNSFMTTFGMIRANNDNCFE